MPMIWCAISGHGYGHAAPVVPVLNEVARRTKGLKVVLRTTVPAEFFQGRLDFDWALSPAEQDIGCVQDGPLHIDIARTWAEHRRFHEEWDTRVLNEAQAIRAAGANVVLSNISYLAIEAAVEAAVPAVGLCSLSWDAVLEPFQDPAQAWHAEILHRIRQAYGGASLMLRPSPGLPVKALQAFPKVVEVGPIRQITKPDPDALRNALGVSPYEKVVLIGFGGIPLKSLPLDRLERMTGFRFIVSGPVPDQSRRVRSHSSIPLPFSAILASVDIVMTKPGYSTIVEAVAHRKPVLYVRRYNFVDEAYLVEYLHRYGRGMELSVRDFQAGHWRDALEAVMDVPPPAEHDPASSGAVEAARFLASAF